MRAILPLVLVLPLVFACGRGFSDSIDGGGHTHGDDDSDAGDDSPDGGACSNVVPSVVCFEPCGGSQVAPSCVDGTWQCPEYAGVECSYDGGSPCDNEEPVGCSAIAPCTGVYQTPVCTDGTWQCEWTGVCDDGGAPDAPYWFDDGGPGPGQIFACGDLSCDPTNSYCQIMTGGAPNDDGGPSSGYSCQPLPGSCPSGHQATCDCVTAWEGVNTCGCIAHNGDVIMTCEIP